MFVKASDVQQSATSHAFPSALYNAGLSYQRCEMNNEAQQQKAERPAKKDTAEDSSSKDEKKGKKK